MADEHPYARLKRRQRERHERRQKFRWIGRVVAWLLLVACVATVAWFVAGNVDVRSVRCTVDSASPDSPSAVGPRGTASAAPGIRVETKECGPIHVGRGVTFDTQAQVARSFSPGSVREFDLSWGDRTVNWKWFKIVPSAKDQRPVEPASSDSGGS